MNVKSSDLLKFVSEDCRSKVDLLLTEVEPDPETLSADELFTVAEYIDRKATAEKLGWNTVERWFLSAYESGGMIDSLHRAAVVRSRLKDWCGAVELYRQVRLNEVDYPEQTVEWFANYGWCAHLAGALDESRTAFGRMLLLGRAKYPEYLHVILDGNTDKFLQKVRASAFLEQFRDEIEVEYRKFRVAGGPASSDLVFTYWAQGIEAAPPVVRASIAAWRREVGERLIVLNEDDFKYWIQFDSEMHDRLPARSARFSDVLRSELLTKYGGTWVDATTFPSECYSDFIAGAERLAIFAPRYHGAAISSWFLKAKNTSALFLRLNAALRVYWRHNNKAIGYFMFHFFFECIALGYVDAREEWNSTLELSSARCHKVQAVMRKDVDFEEFVSRLNSAPIQKMTHKLKDMQVTADCGLAQIVRWAYVPHS